MLENVFIWMCGVIAGAIASRLFTYGTIKIDKSNPEKDLYQLEIKELDKLSKKKRIVLRVTTRSKLSQE